MFANVVARWATAREVRTFIRRRFGVLRSLVVVAVLGTLALGAQPVAVAQEASPAAGVFTEGGITFEPLAFATALAHPTTGELTVSRISLEPGSVLPIEEGDPSYALGFVESGELTVVQNGPMTITRAGALGAAVVASEEGGAFAPATEEIAAGQEVKLGAGDAGLFPPNASGEIRNDGDEPTVVLVVFVGPPIPTGEAASTPTS
jgi:quercetin dioxygenase-like cupin family protein